MLILMIFSILVPFFGGVTIYLLKNRYVNYSLFFFQGLETCLIGYLVLVFMKQGEYHGVIGGWNQDLGIELGVDYLTVLFLMLTVTLWWAAILYMWSQWGSDVKHLFFLLILEGMVAGFLQSRDLFNMFLFIECITIISTILITYHKDAKSVKAGLYYLLFNNLAMLLFLLGVILVYLDLGSLNMYHLKGLISQSSKHPILELAYFFFIAAMGVKAAFFPVYNWLPTAHAAAPSHISALLSGLLVKTGVYGFIRITEMFGDVTFKPYFLWLGIITSLGGVCFAMIQKDIKLILGFHTISQVGLIFTSVSQGTLLSQEAGLTHLLNHGIFKSLLFMGAGMTINMYGTRSVDKIRGLFKKSPMVSVSLLIGSLSITGFPFLSGYAGKHLFLEVFKTNPMVYALINIVNLGTMTSFIKLSTIHLGTPTVLKSSVISWNRRVALIIMGGLCLISFPMISSSVNGHMYLSLWHSLSETLLMDFVKYILMACAGFGLFKLLTKRDYLIVTRLRQFNLGFDTSNVMLIFFIFTMLVYWMAFS